MLPGLDQFQELRQANKETFTGSAAARTSLLWRLPTLQQEFSQPRMRPHATKAEQHMQGAASNSTFRASTDSRGRGSLLHPVVTLPQNGFSSRRTFPALLTQATNQTTVLLQWWQGEGRRYGRSFIQFPPTKPHSQTRFTHTQKTTPKKQRSKPTNQAIHKKKNPTQPKQPNNQSLLWTLHRHKSNSKSHLLTCSYQWQLQKSDFDIPDYSNPFTCTLTDACAGIYGEFVFFSRLLMHWGARISSQPSSDLHWESKAPRQTKIWPMTSVKWEV